jgi:hypothetical protein
LLRLVLRIVVRRWVVAIGTSHHGSEVGCCDWYSVLWFGYELLRFVHRIVIRRWVVTIGTSYCGSYVGCHDWYTALWFERVLI